MVLLLPDTTGIAQGVQQATGALTQALQQGLQSRINQDFSRKILQNLPEEPSFNEILSLIISAPKDISQNLSNVFSAKMKSEKYKLDNLFKMREKTEPIMGALDSLDRMEDIAKSGSAGPFFALAGGKRSFSSFLTPSGLKKARQDREEFSRLGKSLIQYSSNIPIRNRFEFETLSSGLSDPSMDVNELMGSIKGLRRILENSLPKSTENYSNKPSSDKEEIPVGKIYVNKNTGQRIQKTENGWRNL